MDATKLMAMTAVLVIAACRPSTGESARPIDDANAAGEVAPSLQPKAPGAEPNARFEKTIAQMVNRQSELVKIGVSTEKPLAAVAVAFKPENQNQEATCTVSIFEELDGKPNVVESSDRLLPCHSANAVLLSVAINVEIEGGRVRIFKQDAKSNLEFDLKRASSGGWFVTRATFNHSEYNQDTDEMDVISEEAVYPSHASGIRLADYDYEHLRRDLVKTTIE